MVRGATDGDLGPRGVEAALGDRPARGTRGSLSRAGSRGLVVMALAALLAWNRLAWLEWMEFDSEQLDTLVLAHQALSEGGAERGLRLSNGVDMPPLFIDLLAVPLSLGCGPVGVAAFVAVLNLAGIAAFLALARTLFPAPAALVATLLYASMPWSVLFSRKIWAQDLVAPFLIAAAWLLASAWAGARAARLRSALALVVLSLACQLYPSPWFLAPAVALVVALFPPPLGRWGTALAFAAAGLVWLPWLRQQLAEGFDGFIFALESGSDTPRSLADLAGSAWAHARASAAVASGSSLAWLFGPEELQGVASGAASRTAWLAVRAAEGLYGAALLHGALRSALRIRDRWRGATLAAGERVLVLFGLLPPTLVAGYVLAGVPPLPHYHAVLLPLAAVLLVASARGFFAHLPRLSLALPGSLALVNGILVLALLLHVRARGEQLAHRYAPYAPWRAQWEAQLAEALLEARDRGERLARERAQLEARFESSQEVLFRVGGTAEDEQVIPRRGAVVESAGAILRVSGGSVRAFVALPEVSPPAGCSVILHLDLESPRDAQLQVFYRTRATPDYPPNQYVQEPVRRGRSRLYLELAAEDLTSRPLLRLPVASYRLHAVEARAVAR
jgi:hypothetical protein